MKPNGLILAGLLGAALPCGNPSLAAMQGASYALPVSTFAGGGGAASSARYRTSGAIGQASPIGTSLGAEYQLRAGFFFAFPTGQGVTIPIGALELLLLRPNP